MLIRVTNLRVSAVLDPTRFEVAEQATPAGPKPLIQAVYHTQNPLVDRQYASITGIMSEAFGEYRLLPRSAADFFR